MGTVLEFPRGRMARATTEWQGFYSTAQVSRIARIPFSTLQGWKAKGIIVPSLIVVDGGTVIDYGYSYADLTIIKLMRMAKLGKLNLKSVGITFRHLFDRFGPPSKGWADAHVYIVGNNVFAERQDEWETTTATKYGQKIETRLFGDFFAVLREMEEGGSILIPREFAPFVDIKPEVMEGEPVVKNTRVPTRVIYTKYVMGRTANQIAQLYGLARQVIENVIAYETFLSSPIAQVGAAAAGR